MGTVSLKSISKSFGATQVIENISLDIADGEFVVFVGPSGCGKSTLLRMIAGLEEESGGTIEIDGRNVSGLEPVDRGISMVFQNYALYPHMTVFDNIAFPLSIQKLSKADIRARVEKAADILHLNDRLKHKPGQLSGGQRQRVAIGRAIVREPEVFLFDEPLSNLDASLRGEMRVELSELHQSLKTTMIYVTHDQIEAMTMADRIVVLNDGIVEQFGSPMDLYNTPHSKFVAGFIGQPGMNFIPGRIASADNNRLQATTFSGAQLYAEVDCTNANVGGNIEVGIRPEDFSLDKGDAVLDVSLRIVEKLGGTTIVYGNLSDGTAICASLEGAVEFDEKSTVRLRYHSTALHVFNDQGTAYQRTNLTSPQ